jgi:hypothetical protein
MLTWAANSAKFPLLLLMVEGIRSCDPDVFDFFCAVGSGASFAGAG